MQLTRQVEALMRNDGQAGAAAPLINQSSLLSTAAAT